MDLHNETSARSGRNVSSGAGAVSPLQTGYTDGYQYPAGYPLPPNLAPSYIPETLQTTDTQQGVAGMQMPAALMGLMPSMPNVPQMTEPAMMSNTSQVAGLMQTPAMPNNSQVADVTQMPVMPNNTQLAGMMQMPVMDNSSQVAGMMTMPAMPAMPNNSQVAGMMQMPAMDNASQVADMSQMPIMPKTSQMADMMQMPAMDNASQVADMSQMPAMPKDSQMAGMMTMPAMPNPSQAADVSQMPAMPKTSQVAGMMQMPAADPLGMKNLNSAVSPASEMDPTDNEMQQFMENGMLMGPNCFGSEARRHVNQIMDYINSEYQDYMYYKTLARRAPNSVARRVFRTLAADEARHARRLSAAYFLITGKRYKPCRDSVAPVTVPASYVMALRERYINESKDAVKYRQFARSTSDLCLQRLATDLSDDESQHAQEILALIQNM